MQDINNARSDAQKKDMEDLKVANVCLFCPEGLNLKSKRVFHQGEHWYVTPNDFPYAGTTVHVMIVPRRHVVSLLDLLPEELVELPQMFAWVNREFSIRGATMLARYGETSFTGATIHHFHIHIAQGIQKSETTEHLYAAIGYKDKPQPT